MMDRIRKPTRMNHCRERWNDKFFPDMCENAGSKSCVMPSAIKKEIMLMSSDSRINGLANDRLLAPNALRTPTSAERFDERAVDKFMKLMQAISKVNKAMEPRIYKYVTLTVPTDEISLLIPEYR